jgi:hypothetical protein
LRVEHPGTERPLGEQVAALARVPARNLVGYALFVYDGDAQGSLARALLRDGVLVHEPLATRQRIIDGSLSAKQSRPCSVDWSGRELRLVLGDNNTGSDLTPAPVGPAPGHPPKGRRRESSRTP